MTHHLHEETHEGLRHHRAEGAGVWVEVQERKRGKTNKIEKIKSKVIYCLENRINNTSSVCKTLIDTNDTIPTHWKFQILP